MLQINGQQGPVQYCGFAIWMPSALDARGRRPVRPPSLHTTDGGRLLHSFYS